MRAAELGARALEGLDPGVRAGLEVAIANVRAVAEAGIDAESSVTLPQGHTVKLREQPVGRAAIYVPAGRNPYPSTVVMGAVTARAAGVDEVVVAPATTRRSSPRARCARSTPCSGWAARRRSPRSPTAPRPSRPPT